MQWAIIDAFKGLQILRYGMLRISKVEVERCQLRNIINVQIFQIDRDGEEDNNISKNELLEAFPLPENVVIPVNALNYCNVDYSNHHLITPATTDSNNFDLYLDIQAITLRWTNR